MYRREILFVVNRDAVANSRFEIEEIDFVGNRSSELAAIETVYKFIKMVFSCANWGGVEVEDAECVCIAVSKQSVDQSLSKCPVHIFKSR